MGCGAVLLAALVVGVGGAGGRSLATTTLLVEVSGSGSVTGGGGQIGCGAGLVACYATYVSGSSVTISAAADSGWSFDSWSGCNTQSATTCTVNLDGGDHTVTVSFAPNVAPGDSTLTVSAPTDASGNGGNVTAGDEIDCGSDGTDDCTWTDYTGSTFTVVEEPDDGYSFVGWGGACSGTATSCTVSMANDESITATFAQSSSAPELTVSVTGNGTVSGSGIACTSAGGSGCSASESANSTVTLTATPGAGSGFTGWGGACAGTAVSCVVTMDGAKTVTAAFTGGGSSGSTYPLVVAVVGDGTVTGAGISCGSTGSTCTASPAAGSQVKLTAKAASGQSFTGWSGACSGRTATCALTMSAAKSVTATFTGTSSGGGGGGGGGGAPALTAAVTGPGRITGAGLACGNGAQTCSASVTTGLAVSLTATPAAGATFAGWGGACHGTDRLCRFVATGDTTITAAFRSAGSPQPGGKPAPLLRSGGRPIVQRTETGYAVTLRFRMAKRSAVRVRALRAGLAEASFSFTGAAGADEVGPFPLTKSGFYRFEVTVSGGSLHWTACLGVCGERATAVAFAFGRRPPDVKRAGARWSVALRFRSTVPAGVDVRVYRSGNLAHETRFPVRAGVAAARPLLLAPGSYAFKVIATDAYGRIRLLTWIVVLP